MNQRICAFWPVWGRCSGAEHRAFLLSITHRGTLDHGDIEVEPPRRPGEAIRTDLTVGAGYRALVAVWELTTLDERRGIVRALFPDTWDDDEGL